MNIRPTPTQNVYLTPSKKKNICILWYVVEYVTQCLKMWSTHQRICSNICIYIYIYIYIYSDVSLNTAKTIHPTPTKYTKICILWCVVEYVTQSVWRYVIQCQRLSSSTTHQRIDSLWHSRDSKCVKICNTHQRLSSRYIYTYSLVCRSEQDKFSSFWYDKF